jgi:hypothetical protein
MSEERGIVATNSSAPHAFALAVPEGRTQKALNILGAEVLVKLGISDTDGALALFYPHFIATPARMNGSTP